MKSSRFGASRKGSSILRCLSTIIFPDKDAILLALGQEGFAKIGKVLPKPGSGAPLDVLRKATLQYIDFGLKQADEYEMVFMTRLGNGTANPKAPAEENNWIEG